MEIDFNIILEIVENLLLGFLAIKMKKGGKRVS